MRLRALLGKPNWEIIPRTETVKKRELPIEHQIHKRRLEEQPSLEICSTASKLNNVEDQDKLIQDPAIVFQMGMYKLQYNHYQIDDDHETRYAQKPLQRTNNHYIK